MLAPIILFVYNRPWHTQQTVEALQKNELASESVLYVFADGEKPYATEEQRENIAQVRNYIRTISGFKEVHIEEAEQNKGLANSVISGVTKIINKYGKVIVVEDDIVTHRYFLRYMNDALDFYEKDSRIYMIGGFRLGFKIPWCYTHDVFIVHRSCSWGWATWKNRWITADWAISDYCSFSNDKIQIDRFCRGGNDMFLMLQNQMNGKLDSWAIRWDYCMYKHDAYCLWPKYSMAQNIGFDGSGVHCGNDIRKEDSALQLQDMPYKIKFVKNISSSKRIEKTFRDFCNHRPKESLIMRVKGFVKKIIE